MPETAVIKRPLAAPMVQAMQGLMPHVPALLPADISAEQFRAALYLELSGRPSLGECTPESLRDAVLKAATYGLLPGRDCHLLPFSNRRKGGKKEATYVPNYFGVILALMRSGKVRRAFAHPVHEGDEWGFDMFQDRPIHKPAVTLGTQPGRELFYYGAVMFHDGSCAFEVVSLDDIEAVMKRAPAHDSGPWVTDRVMMCRKTALKRVAKYIKLTPDVRGMLEEDAVREGDDIPPARHRQNVVDLFGEGSDPTAPPPTAPRQTGAVDPETGELQEDASQAPMPNAQDYPLAGEPDDRIQWEEEAAADAQRSLLKD
jgi:phage RecT family recombinase